MNIMKLKANLILAMILLLNVSLFAQNGRNLTGKVLDANNDPLIGVNILIASSSTGTMTDVDGSYSLTVNSGDVVEFSYLGYFSKSVTIADQTELNVVLEEDIEGLNEIVEILSCPSESLTKESALKRFEGHLKELRDLIH